jgi:hypothetical protein
MVFPIKCVYNEYKYLVSERNLEYVLATLEAVASGTDPYPDGIVESCYFDSLSMTSLKQCKDGSARKIKFRIRRYDDNSLGQVQIKSKNLYGVGKLKCHLPVWDIYSEWRHVLEHAEAGGIHHIKAISSTYSPLYPVVNVSYRRRRYQFMGCRITLDSRIKAFPYLSLRAPKGFILLPQSVLEIKSDSPTPFLPEIFKGLVKYGSFSKYAYLSRILMGEDQI